MVSTEPAAADHVTAVLEVPLTVAVNCCLWFEVSVVLVGDTPTLTFLLLPFPTSMWKVLLPLLWKGEESVTVTSNEYVPDVVGTPESVPVVGFKLMPGGKTPAFTEKR